MGDIVQALMPILEKYIPEADDFRFRLDNDQYIVEALINDNWTLIMILSHLNEFTTLDETDLINIKLRVEAYLQHKRDEQYNVRTYV